MSDPQYSKKESVNRILRALEGTTEASNDPETLKGDVLAEDEALSHIAALMAGILPNQAGVLPPAIRSHRAAYSDSKDFYVIPDHPNASDANTGENPAYPLATVNQAVTNSRAYRGDVIWVTSSDSWQYGARTENGVVECLVIPADKPGIALVGVSRGSEGCYWQPTGTAAFCIEVRALDVTIDGFCFWANAGTAKGIYCNWNSGNTYYGENTIICNNTFTDDCTTGIQMEYTWYVDIFNNRFQQCDDYGISVSISGSGVNYVRIYDNWFNDCGIAMYLNNCDQGIIRSNHVYCQEAQSTGTCTNMGINTALGSYNLVEDNYLSCTLAKWDEFNSGAATDAWIFNHCLDGNNTAGPT